jgi:hypothetical protein
VPAGPVDVVPVVPVGVVPAVVGVLVDGGVVDAVVAVELVLGGLVAAGAELVVLTARALCSIFRCTVTVAVVWAGAPAEAAAGKEEAGAEVRPVDRECVERCRTAPVRAAFRCAGAAPGSAADPMATPAATPPPATRATRPAFQAMRLARPDRGRGGRGSSDVVGTSEAPAAVARPSPSLSVSCPALRCPARNCESASRCP